MVDSLIICYLIKSARKLNYYYMNSGLHSLFSAIGKGFSGILEGSGITGFFSKEWHIEDAWVKSKLYKFFTLPLRLIGTISRKSGDKLGVHIKNSTILSAWGWLFSNLFNISVRIYGILLLAFTITEGTLWILLRVNAWKYILLRCALLLFAFVLIGLDRSLKELYEGSFIAQLAGNFFKVRGVEDGTDNG